MMTSSYFPSPAAESESRDYGDGREPVGEAHVATGLTEGSILLHDIASESNADKVQSFTQTQCNPSYSHSLEDLRAQAHLFASGNHPISSDSIHQPTAALATAEMGSGSEFNNSVHLTRRKAVGAAANGHHSKPSSIQTDCCSRKNCAACLALSRTCSGCAPRMHICSSPLVCTQYLSFLGSHHSIVFVMDLRREL